MTLKDEQCVASADEHAGSTLFATPNTGHVLIDDEDVGDCEGVKTKMIPGRDEDNAEAHTGESGMVGLSSTTMRSSRC